MNSNANINTAAPTEPDIVGDARMVTRVCSELIDVTHESILSQHKITQGLITRLGMVSAHIEHLERLMARDTREQYEGEHEQAMTEYRFLDSFISGIERSNDAFVDRMQSIQGMWESAKETKQ
jgi:hypothetical protein